MTDQLDSAALDLTTFVLGPVAFGDTLKGKEAQIFHQRMLTEEPRTLQELGDEFGVSRERVRQLEKRLQLKLKQYLSDQLGDGLFEP